MKRVLVATLVAAGLAACAIFGPAERTEIAKTASTLETCQELARACQADSGEKHDCYAKYDACVTDAGLR